MARVGSRDGARELGHEKGRLWAVKESFITMGALC